MNLFLKKFFVRFIASNQHKSVLHFLRHKALEEIENRHEPARKLNHHCALTSERVAAVNSPTPHLVDSHWSRPNVRKAQRALVSDNSDTVDLN